LKKNFTIGIWLNNAIAEDIGGGYQYYRTIINILKTVKSTEFEIKFFSEHQIRTSEFDVKKLDFPKYKYSRFQKILDIVFTILFNNRKYSVNNYKKKYENEIINILNKEFHIIYYITPEVKFDFYPYIYTLWDIGHIASYGFPEWTFEGRFESRENQLNLLPKKAQFVFVESEAGKKDAIRYLNINDNRIKIIPMIPSQIIDDNVAEIQINKLIDVDFFHYPAQFWAHKNHYFLITEFKEFSINFPNVKLVLTGSDKGNLKYIQDLIEYHNIADKIIYLGFVKLEELKWIYKKSLALVFPTLLGPTNMPILEASILGCRVLCSNLNGHQEQIKDGVEFFDPLIKGSLTSLLTKTMNFGKGVNPNLKWNTSVIKNSIELAMLDVKRIRMCWN